MSRGTFKLLLLCLAAHLSLAARHMCIFAEVKQANGRVERNVRNILNQFQRDQCTRNQECTCAEILTKCMFGPDHLGEFVT